MEPGQYSVVKEDFRQVTSLRDVRILNVVNELPNPCSRCARDYLDDDEDVDCEDALPRSVQRLTLSLGNGCCLPRWLSGPGARSLQSVRVMPQLHELYGLGGLTGVT